MDRAPAIGLLFALMAIPAALGFFTGRMTAPTKSEKVKSEQTAEAKQQQTTTAETLALRGGITSTVHESTVRYPDGRVRSDVVHKLEARTERTVAAVKTETKTDIRYVDRIEKETVIREAPRTNWGAALGGGLREGAALTYRAEVSRRIGGPFWLTVGVATAPTFKPQEASVMLGVQW